MSAKNAEQNNMEEETKIDKYAFADSEHLGGQHKTFTENCYECSKEARIISSYKIVNKKDA